MDGWTHETYAKKLEARVEDAKLLLSTASEDYCANNCDFSGEGKVEAHDATCQRITAFLQSKT